MCILFILLLMERFSPKIFHGPIISYILFETWNQKNKTESNRFFEVEKARNGTSKSLSPFQSNDTAKLKIQSN